MLAWRKERNGWVSNGYRIELLEPHHWVLVKNEPSTELVRAKPIPLAEARTLTQCKREAQLLDAADRLGLIRRRRWGQLIMAVMAFAFVPSMPPPLDLIVFLVLLAIAAGAIGFLAGTYMASSHLAISDMCYQRVPIRDHRLCLWPTRYLARFRIGL